MAKKPKSWYAWHDAAGEGGIYKTWSECEAACSGHPGEKHKGFETEDEARAFAFPSVKVPNTTGETGISAPMEQEKQEHGFNITADSNGDDLKTEVPFQKIDPARISHAEISEKVNRFCKEYGFTQLSEEQRRAVQSVDGKVLLFAVPGSGKTTVLIARTGYMVHSCNISPDSIVSLTFTKASAAEMGERYCKRFPNDTVLPEFRTIHSFAFSVIIPMLRRSGYSIPQHMINEVMDIQEKKGERKRRYSSVIYSEINEELRKISEEQQEVPVLLQGRKDRETLETAFTGIKNTRMTRAQLRGKTIHLNSGRDLPADRAYDIYINLCKKYHCMDFDDMLAYALDGLQKHPEVLLQLQKRYHYWSIDEAQDNSPLQHDLLQLLVGKNGNLFMVGDDDQSIYAFRGAKPQRFQQFGMEPDVTVLTMGSNYRSAAGIVKTAETIIRENTTHQEKQMHAVQTIPGRIRFIYDLHSEKHQYEKIVETARECSKQGKELAVLYRENISALPVIFWLDKNKIPFFTAAKLTELLQSPYVARILNLLRFIVKQNSYELCIKAEKALNIYPSDENSVRWRKACNAEPDRNVIEILSKIDKKDYSSVLGLLADAVNAAPYDAIKKCMQQLGISPQNQSERMQVSAILSTSELYDTIPEMLAAIDAMKRKLHDNGEEEDNDTDSLPASEDEMRKDACCKVTLTTMHSAKGLEFDHVMIIDLLEPPAVPITPTQLVFDDPEEPRRLFYVAITRAKQFLDILTVQSYYGIAEKPHPFIREYAAICDQQDQLSEYAASIPGDDDCQPVITYGKYYGVPVGRIPGVYTSWDEALAQTKNIPGTHEHPARHFPTWEEAAAYAYPDGIPDDIRPIDTSALRKYLVANPTLRANWPQDIPFCITRGILELLHTDSLLSLDPKTCDSLKMNYISSHTDAYDYSGARALAYTVSYLPLNYYKVWTPLWKLLEKRQLPFRANVLELGAGPGTSGLALLDFYGKLASKNPNIQFAVQYTAVERESAFLRILEHLLKKAISELPGNLHVSTRLVRTDAVDFLKQLHAPTYNIVLESNMLNLDEDITENALSVISKGIACGLNEHGHVILIEPGKKDQITILEKIVLKDAFILTAGPEITSVDTSFITLVKQCKEMGIRYKETKEHWYSVVIAERKAI